MVQSTLLLRLRYMSCLQSMELFVRESCLYPYLRTSNILNARLITRRGDALYFRVLVIFLNKPSAIDHHWHACIRAYCDIGYDFDKRQLMWTISQFTIKVCLVKVYYLLFSRLILSLFFVSSKNVT